MERIIADTFSYQIMTPDSERRNSTAMYNPMTLGEIKSAYAGLHFDWDLYFSNVFSDTGVSINDTERIIVVQPDYFNSSQYFAGSAQELCKCKLQYYTIVSCIVKIL